MRLDEWLEWLFVQSPMGVGLISSAESRCVRANEALAQIYGMPVQEILAADPFTLALKITHPEDLPREQALFAELVEGTRRSYQIEKRYVQPDGTIRWGWLTYTWILDEGSSAVTPSEALRYVLVQVIDVTERKLAEEAVRRLEHDLRHAQKIDGIGRLAAGVAHDFNNLLTVIVGHAEVAEQRLRTGGRTTGDLSENLAVIIEATERASALTTQLLAYGRRGPLAPTTFSLSEELRRLETLMTRTLGPRVEIEVSSTDEGWIHADRGQVGQVVMNLVFNARDAMPDGGRVRISTRDVLVPQGMADPHGRNPGAWVAVAVSDAGHGMSPEVQARMFEAFFTTRGDRSGTSGTGLGLATVAQIVKDAAGHIGVESEAGTGTTVTVWFPRAPKPVQQAGPRRAPNPPMSGTSWRVLVVEDEPSVRILLGTVLMGAGYWVAVARDATEALAFVDKEAPFDLVVTDLLMPGVDGGELARRIAARGKSPRFLFVSGYSDRSTADLSLHGRLLPKPFTPTQLLDAVRESLATGSRADSAASSS